MIMSCVDYDALYASLLTLVEATSAAAAAKRLRSPLVASYAHAALWSLLDPRHGLSVPVSFDAELKRRPQLTTTTTTSDHDGDEQRDNTDRLIHALRITFEASTSPSTHRLAAHLSSFVAFWSSSRLLLLANNTNSSSSTSVNHATLLALSDTDPYTWPRQRPRRRQQRTM